MFDLLVMEVTFTAYQQIGFGLLFLFYGAGLVKFILEQRVRVMEPDDKFVPV